VFYNTIPDLKSVLFYLFQSSSNEFYLRSLTIKRTYWAGIGFGAKSKI